jgi:hypothetical protein
MILRGGAIVHDGARPIDRDDFDPTARHVLGKCIAMRKPLKLW